jgi:hypothetical protein
MAFTPRCSSHRRQREWSPSSQRWRLRMPTGLWANHRGPFLSSTPSITSSPTMVTAAPLLGRSRLSAPCRAKQRPLPFASRTQRPMSRQTTCYFGPISPFRLCRRFARADGARGQGALRVSCSTRLRWTDRHTHTQADRQRTAQATSRGGQPRAGWPFRPHSYSPVRFVSPICIVPHPRMFAVYAPCLRG